MECRYGKIPVGIADRVDLIVNEIINYDNLHKKGWMEVYDDVLNRLGVSDCYKRHKLLTFVVRKLSVLGYDIVISPFKLVKYR